jgi:hypothetical protein
MTRLHPFGRLKEPLQLGFRHFRLVEEGFISGFSTIFSTTVENFGGRPYGLRRKLGL